MAVVVVKTALLHRAIDQGLDPTPGAIARAVGVSERTMRRALSGAPISDWTQNALKHRFRDESLFRIVLAPCADPEARSPADGPAAPASVA